MSVMRRDKPMSGRAPAFGRVSLPAVTKTAKMATTSHRNRKRTPTRRPHGMPGKSLSLRSSHLANDNAEWNLDTWKIFLGIKLIFGVAGMTIETKEDGFYRNIPIASVWKNWCLLFIIVLLFRVHPCPTRARPRIDEYLENTLQLSMRVMPTHQNQIDPDFYHEFVQNYD